MGVSYCFMDNCVYGADDINNAFSKLTTQGVSLFNYSDGDNPLISLNDAVANYTGPGIEFYNVDACKLTYDSEQQKYTILKGNAFMVDGTIITIDDEGYDITEEVKLIRLNSDNDIYVSFYRNVAKNTIDILVLDNDLYAEDENNLPIAVIMGTDNILDKRTFAVSRVAPASGNIVHHFYFGAIRVSNSTTKLYHTKEGIFPGAAYAMFMDMIIPIQRVATQSGEELEYSVYFGQLGDLYIALNMTDDGLQLWMYVKSGVVSITNGNCWVF